MNSTAQLSTAPEITVNRFTLSGFESIIGEYANETQVITVEVENTGNEYLKDIVVSCEIFHDPGLTSLAADLGQNQTVSLEVGEIMEFEFWSWTPFVADPMIATSFWVNITAAGIGFKDVMNIDVYPTTEVVIREMTIIDWVPNLIYDTMGTIMTPRPYVEEMMPNVETYNYSGAVHTAQFNIINLGNVEATNVVVEVDGYDISSATPWVSVFNDQETVVSLMPWMPLGWTDFSTNTWDLTTLVADGQLNLTISSGADYLPANTTHYFEVADFYDVKPMMLTTDLVEQYNTFTFNTTATHDFRVMIVNNGNQQIDTDFWARLNATNWTGQGPVGWEYDFGYQMIDGATTNLNPGDASAEVWAGIAPPGVGIYQFNVTSPGKDPTNLPGPEQNTNNNMTSILLTFQDTEGLSLVLNTPSDDSKWPVMNLPIKVAVTNTGTLDFADLGGCEVSLMIYDNNETMADTSDDILLWYPANVTIPGLGMTMTDSTSAKWTWTGAEGGKEYLVVVNATVGTTIVGQGVTITFPHPNGTVSGMITTPANTAGIEIKAWEGATEILMTTTDATGYYEMSLEALPTAYNITVTAPYGYLDAYNNTVIVKDDLRITIVNFYLGWPPVGDVNGTITLVEVGMPATPAVDYTDIVVAVEGTPLWVNADADGNYSLPQIVPNIVNVTATMLGFTSAWNDSVNVYAGEVTENVNFILTEDWDVMVDPAHESNMVAVDMVITVTFEEEINITSVNLTNTFEVEDSTGTTVVGVIEWATGNMSFTFIPDANLTANTEYTIWLCTDITNLTEVEVLHRDWESTFVTSIIDPPYWIKGYVTDAWNGDPIERTTVNAGTAITKTDATGAYTLTIGAGVYDVTASKPLYLDDTVTGVYVVAAVATENINLTLTPIVNIKVLVMVGGVDTAVEPEGATLTGVDNDTVVVMEFAEAINTSRLGFFTLGDSGATWVTGFVAWDAMDMTVTFTPEENLTEGETYTLTIMDTVESATEAAILPRDVTWQFTIEPGHPPPPPIIYPPDGATDVPVDAEVKIDFGCEMNITATEAAITAAFGTGMTWGADNKTVTISHDDFAQNTYYTVSIAATAESIEGYVTLAATSTFTTEDGDGPYEYDLGDVTDADGAVAGATVTITDPNGDTIWIGTTAADGSIEFTLLVPLADGTYTLTVTKTGYGDLTADFTVAGGTATPPSAAELTMTKTADGDGDGDDGEDDNMLTFILIIIVIIIILIILALAMRPKKPAEEELEEEEAEDEEGMEEEEFECPECGAAVSSGEMVCPECGAEFEEEEFECPECGAKLEAGAGVCPECGAEFEAEEEELEEGEEEELEDDELEEEELEEEEEEELPWEEEELPEEEEELPLEEEEEELIEELPPEITIPPTPAERKPLFYEPSEATPSQIVNVKSAINYEHAKVVYKVKIENNSPSAISEVRVQTFIPRENFQFDKDETTIPLIKSNQSKTATFTLRPTGECGNVDISGKIIYYDTKLSDYKELKITPRPTAIICPMLRIAKTDENTWRSTTSQLISVKEITEDIPLSFEELFEIVSDVVKDMNMFMLKPSISTTRRVGRFYCEGIKGLKYAVQLEAIGGMQKSKLILKAFASDQKSLIGFYHKILDEIEDRINIKEYIKGPLIIEGDYFPGGKKIDIKDSVVQRSEIGKQTKSKEDKDVEWK